MYGALVGDCVGSFWEFSGNKDPNIPLWVPACRFTDDSVCTGAIAQWLHQSPDGSGAALTQCLHGMGRLHAGRGFANRMMEWVFSDRPQPYGSWGNGSAMRASPIALWARDEAQALDWAARSAAPTHNHEEGVRGAQATVWAIRQAFIHRDPLRLLAEVEARFGYPDLTTRDPAAERPSHVFDVSCKGTVPLAVVIACRAGSFREALRTCCSMGGDADTLGAIAGPLAEALYGIPEADVREAHRRYHEEDGIWEPVVALYALPDVQNRLAQWGRPNGTLLPTPPGEPLPGTPMVRSRLKHS